MSTLLWQVFLFVLRWFVTATRQPDHVESISLGFSPNNGAQLQSDKSLAAFQKKKQKNLQNKSHPLRAN